MKKEFTAKTIDEAKELAAAEFGVSAGEIDFDAAQKGSVRNEGRSKGNGLLRSARGSRAG